jgi:hypothetical protein
MSSKSTRLGNLADLHVGYQFRGRVGNFVPKRGKGQPPLLPVAKVRVIQIKDIPDRHRLRADELDEVDLYHDPGPYEVRQGDVLFLVRGHNPFATPVVDPVNCTIAAGYFVIIRAKSDAVTPEYLAWYMNQPDFQSALKPLMRGSHMPLVTKSDVESLAVRVPPMDVQRTIVALDGLARREQELLAALASKRAELHQAINRAALAGLHQ